MRNTVPLNRTSAPGTGRGDLAGLLACLLICYGVSAIGGLLTAPSVGTWYAALNKPAWTPPDWVFTPVWLTLFTMMGLAAWLVWRRRHHVPVGAPLVFFGIQLALNAA